MINNKLIVSEIQLYGIYSIALLYTSGTFIGIYDLGWRVFIPLFLIFCFFGFFKLKNSSDIHVINQFDLGGCFNSIKNQKIRYLLLASPVFIYLFLTWNQEFPFIGDHDFHLSQSYTSEIFWINFKWQTLLLLFSFVIAIRLKSVKYWIPLAGIMLIWWSRYDTLPWHQISHAFYVRYPALARFFSVPFMYIAILTDSDKMYNFSRILNLFSLFLWMIFLRPFFLKRKIDASFALFALFFLFQSNVIYYFNTNYLEPLASILLLLAVESLFVFRQSNGYVAACLLVGSAAMVKEQAILVLPWVWLAGKPWTWRDRQWVRGIIVGTSSVLPFFIYYLVRAQRMDSARNFKLITVDQWIDPERYITLFGRLGYHLGGYGIAAMSLMLILSVIAVFENKEYRAAILCTLGAALTQIVFFFADANSSGYLGYFRFAFLAVALIAGIILSVDLSIRKSMYFLKYVSLFLFFAASYNLLSFFKGIYEGDMNRNFIEHSDAPIFLPISKLIEKAESQHLLRKGDHVYITDNTGYHINSAFLHYTKMASVYSFEINKLFRCRCDQDVDAVMVPFVYFSGMNAGLKEFPPKPSPFAAPPQKMAESWFAANEKKEQCYKDMKNSCNAVVTEEFNGELIGLLGVKR